MIIFCITLFILFCIWSVLASVFKAISIGFNNILESAPEAKYKKTYNGDNNRHHKLGYKIKADKYITGILHCVGCDIAGHFYTLGLEPCYDCGGRMKECEAKWDDVNRRWIFRDD